MREGGEGCGAGLVRGCVEVEDLVDVGAEGFVSDSHCVPHEGVGVSDGDVFLGSGGMLGYRFGSFASEASFWSFFALSFSFVALPCF